MSASLPVQAAPKTPHEHPPAGLAFHDLVVKNPLAALSLLPKSAVLFAAGAAAGGIGKTLTAPLDRIRITFQVRGGFQTGALKRAAEAGDPFKAFLAIGRQEGILGYWKGNVPVLLRILPFSAVQLLSYEAFKKAFQGKDGELSVPRRLAAGACTGMTATLVTYPLDTLRLRMTVDPNIRTMTGAAVALLKEGGPAAFYRGLGPCLIGIAPYMALELATFDLLPKTMPPFLRGFSAALFSSSITYPLDTIRRQIQLHSAAGLGMREGLQAAVSGVGWRGLYAGFIPSTLTNMPNKGIRLAVFDGAKKLLTTAEQEYKQEVERRQAAGARGQGQGLGRGRLAGLLEREVQPLQMAPLPVASRAAA